MEHVNGSDNSQPLKPPGLHWWLFRIVIQPQMPPGVQPRAVMVVAIHMAGAIETALRSIGNANISDADVIACDRSAPVNCISTSVLHDMQMQRAAEDARAS